MTDYIIEPETLEIEFQAVIPTAVTQNSSLTSPLLKAIAPDKMEECEYLITIHPAIYREQRLTFEMTPDAARRYQLLLRSIDASLCEFRNLLRDIFILIQPYEAPYPVLPFLAPMVGIAFNFDVPEESARREIANAVFLWKRKGTRDNISDWIGLITGFRSHIREYYKEVLRTNVYNQAYAATPSTITNKGGTAYGTLPHLSETHLTNTWSGSATSLPFYSFYKSPNDNYGTHGYTQNLGNIEGYIHIATVSEGWDDFEPLPGTERRVESIGFGELAPGFLFRNHIGLFLDIPDDKLETTYFGQPVYEIFIDKLRRILDLIILYGVVTHIFWRLISEEVNCLCESMSFDVIPSIAEGWNDYEEMPIPYKQIELKSCLGIEDDGLDYIGETYNLSIASGCASRLANFIMCTNHEDRLTNSSTLDSFGSAWLTWFPAKYWDEHAGRYPVGIPTMGTPGEKVDGDILQTWTPTYTSTFTSEVIIAPELSVGEQFINPLIGSYNGQGVETVGEISDYVLNVAENGVFEDNILNFVEEWNSAFSDAVIFNDNWNIPEMFADTLIHTDDWNLAALDDQEIHSDNWNIDVTFLDNIRIIEQWDPTEVYSDELIIFEDWEEIIPLTIPGPGVWLDGNNGPMGNSPIHTWLDRFNDPGGNNAVQSVVAKRPDHDPSHPGYSNFGAVTFDGVNDYMTIPDDPSLNGNEFTVFLVCRWNAPSFNTTIVSKSSSENFTDGWGLTWSYPSNLRFWVDNRETHYAEYWFGWLTSSIICARYDGERISLYMDGLLRASMLYGGGVNNSPKDLVLGAHNTLAGGFSGFMQGTIAEFIYYDRAVTNEEQILVTDYLSEKYELPIDYNTLMVFENWEFNVLYGETLEVNEEFEFTQEYNEETVIDEEWEEYNIPNTPVLQVFDDFEDPVHLVNENWNFSPLYDEEEILTELFEYTALYTPDPVVIENWETQAEVSNPGNLEYSEHWSAVNKVLGFGPESWNPSEYVVDSTSSFFYEDWSPTEFTTDSSSLAIHENWDATYEPVLEFGPDNWNMDYDPVLELGPEDWSPSNYDSELGLFEDWDT